MGDIIGMLSVGVIACFEFVAIYAAVATMSRFVEGIGRDDGDSDYRPEDEYWK
jgi:hypothetical protein